MSTRANRLPRGARIASMTTFGAVLTEVRAVRKTRQLCKEVARTLTCALGAATDPLLGELTVIDVEPAPDAARLMVTVCAMSPNPIELPQLLDRLRVWRGVLRAEIAATLQRKRTPELVFRVAPSAWSQPAESPVPAALLPS